jgi:hypothetical protein
VAKGTCPSPVTHNAGERLVEKTHAMLVGPGPGRPDVYGRAGHGR